MRKKAQSHGIEGWRCYKETTCHHVMASCCVRRLHFSGTVCVCAIYSLRIHYYNTRKVEGRTHHSQILITI